MTTEKPDTPETDAELFKEHWGGEHVRADFARSLEIRLRAAEVDARRYRHVRAAAPDDDKWERVCAALGEHIDTPVENVVATIEHLRAQVREPAAPDAGLDYLCRHLQKAHCPDCDEAAAAIERLTREVARLRGVVGTAGLLTAEENDYWRDRAEAADRAA